MTRHLRLLAASLALLSGSVLACGPYKVAFYEHGVLYFRDAQGQFSGIDRDVISELAKRSGCVFQPVLESRVRIWDQMARHQLDISVSGIPTPERERYAEFMLYMQSHNYVLMPKGLNSQLSSMAAFLADTGRQIVVVKSFKHGLVLDAWLEQLRAQQRVMEAPDFEAALRVLKAGRVDAMLALPTTWALLVRRDEAHKQFDLLDWAPHNPITIGLVMSRHKVNEVDRRRLRQALLSMRRDGTLDAIIKRYVGPELLPSLRLDASADLPS